MNLCKIIITMLMTMSVVEARRGRFQAKGNMRGTVNFASGLSPVQVKVMQLLARQRCLRRGRYGRFSNKFCWLQQTVHFIFFVFSLTIKTTKIHIIFFVFTILLQTLRFVLTGVSGPRIWSLIQKSMWWKLFHVLDMHVKWTLIHLRSVTYFRSFLALCAYNTKFDPLSNCPKNELSSTSVPMIASKEEQPETM